MEKRIFCLAMMMAVVAILAGCGGGGTGGGSSETVVPPPVEAINTWIDRAGSSQTVLFKRYTSSVLSSLKASDDGFGGVIAMGRNNAASNNKGVLTRLDSTGNESWRVQIDSPLGNTFIPHDVTSDSSRIVATYERLPLHDWNIYAYDMEGNGGLISETNIGYGLTSAKVLIDGNNLLISRIEPVVPLAPPIPFSDNMLIYASMVSSDAPISVSPAIKPEFVTLDAGGINVVGDGQHMKYARDLSVLQAPMIWSSGVSPVIHDVKSIGDKTYVAGVVGGILILSEISNPAFRSTARIPVGSDNVRLYVHAGDLFVSVGNRIGKVEIATGEISTINPTAIDENVIGFISGSNIFFIADGNTLNFLPLTEVR